MTKFPIYLYQKTFFQNLFFVTLIVLSLSSCVSTTKLSYFQGDTASYVPLKPVIPNIELIQPNDLLAITVGSLDEETTRMYNFALSAKIDYNSVSTTGSSQGIGYEVDSLGMVNIPISGLVKVGGLTTRDAAEKIRTELMKYVKDVFVNVKIINHKFTILGEVNRPGTYNLVDNQISLIEGFGLAGDLTDYGRRDNIMLIRQENGKRSQIRLNILSKNILNSPYYYLKKDDIIYVDVAKTKAFTNDESIKKLTLVLTVLSALSTITLIFTRFNN